MGRAARGWRGAKERETPSILGDDGPVGELAFLLVLSHVAHTLGRSFVSQCYTTNRPHRVPVNILLAPSVASQGQQQTEAGEHGGKSESRHKPANGPNSSASIAFWAAVR